MVKFPNKLTTDGRGFWSRSIKTVTCTKLAVPYIDDEEEFGELRVYFDTKTWDVNQEGLIYTDEQWLKELRAALKAQGFKTQDVDYSEQGMQGDDYVSLDVGKKFIKSWLDVVTI